MESKVTRRQLAASLAGGAVLLGQTPAGPPPLNAVDEVQAARDQFRKNAEALSKVSLSMSTEPAFQFKA